MKTFFYLLSIPLFFVLLFFLGLFFFQGDPTHIARQSTYLVEVDGEPSGTAVQIAKGKFLTAAHVVEGAESVMVYDGKFRHAADVIYQNEGTDISVLLSSTRCPCVPVSPSPPEVDEPVFTIGHPLAWIKRVEEPLKIVTDGRFQSRQFFKGIDKDKSTPLEMVFTGKSKDFYLTSVYVSEGNSGGGLFVVRAGNPWLVGIAHAYPAKPTLGPFGVQAIKFKPLGLFATWENIVSATESL